MSPLLLFSFVVAYFILLLVVAYWTSRGSDNESFFIGNRNSNWMLVAFGMIGTSLSGVTFVSVPGAVARDSFSYFQITLGYFLGYLLIAYVLLPLYYRLHLTSIYNYLNERLGFTSYKTGAAFFILSRVLGATARLYLVVNILQDAILSGFHIPFWLTTLIILLMILCVDRYPANDLHAGRNVDLRIFYFASVKHESLRRITGHAGKRIFQNFLYRSRQQTVFS